jgi:sulfur-carrier protein
MHVTLKYFASLREALGKSTEVFAVPATVATVGQLRQHLVAQGAPYAEPLAAGRAVRAALNQTVCDDAQVLVEGAEVAFFPPVTGG